MPNGNGVILKYAAPGLLAGQAADAEFDFLPLETDLFRLVPGVLRPGDQPSGENVGIAPGTQTGGDDEYLAHVNSLPYRLKAARPPGRQHHGDLLLPRQ